MADVPDTESTDVAILAERVMEYLEAHPDAADSLDGIAQWWLGSGDRGADPAAVQQALDRLVRQRTVEQVTMVDGRVIYRKRDH